MEGTEVKIKLWIDAISKDKIHGIANELEETFNGPLTEKENKGLFKMLLYLSHTANKCDKSVKKTGFELWRICCCICSKLTEILDPKKFFASIYHIAICLSDMRLYKETLQICDYVMPGELLKIGPSNYEDLYSKMANWMHYAILTELKQSNVADHKHCQLLITMMTYALDLTTLAHRQSCSHFVLSKMLTYFEKVGALDDKSGKYLFQELTPSMLTYIGQQKITLDDNNKKETYRAILSIIIEMISHSMKKKANGSIDHEVSRYFNPFRSCITIDDSSYLRGFNFYERLLKAIIRPINKVPQHVNQEIDACTCELRKIIMFYGYDDVIRSYSYSAIFLFSDLLIYWSRSLKDNTLPHLSYDFVLSMMNFLDEQCNIFDCYELNTCRCDASKKCKMQYDLYNNVALRLKALLLISRFSTNAKNEIAKSKTNNNNDDGEDDEKTIGIKNLFNLAFVFSQESVARITAIKKTGCIRWSILWTTCGGHIYNLGVSCESKFHKMSIKFYSLLYANFVEYEGINGVNGKTLLNLSYPLFSILHRITSVHLSNNNYEEAMIACSLNGLISSKIIVKENDPNECKAYRSWALIKKKYPPAIGLTMLQCFKLNRKETSKVIKIQLEDYDLPKIWSREIRALVEPSRVDLSSSIIAVIDEMEKLACSVKSYVQAVQWLGFHHLNNKCSVPIDRYLKKAIAKYESKPQPDISLKLSYGHITFYEFCQLLRDISKNIEEQIESGKSANIIYDSPKNDESVPILQDELNIVPTYNMLNITITKQIEPAMEIVLHIWKETLALDKNYKNALEHWEIVQLVTVGKILGEYARLYHLESVEDKAWKFAYKLACELNDHRSIVYITMRSLSSRSIDRRWIEEANKSVEILEKSNESDDKSVIKGYKLSLANFDLHNGNLKSAKELFSAATAERRINFSSDLPNSFLVTNLEMNSVECEAKDQSQYSRIIVESLYIILSIDEDLEGSIFNCKLKELYHYDVLFEITYNLTHRMNSLVSWREITAHLMRRLASGQKLGAALRVAECLKCLCYIDLSRAKLDDCEVKLQGLEHILEIEDFRFTMKSQLAEPNLNDRILTSSSSRSVETVRDIGGNNTSPLLRVKRFAKPDFISHSKVCLCFKCTNSVYQSLVFAATHLRAQLFSLRRNSEAAFQHFEGAAIIKKDILSKAQIRPEQNRLKNEDDKHLIKSQSYHQREIVEYIIFHLDYCRFLKWSMPECNKRGFEIALQSLDLCEKYNLKNHPIYPNAKQLILDYQFEIAFTNFSKFTVPSMEEMDAVHEIHKADERHITCVTPSIESINRKPISVRRRKDPPFLNLEKVPIDLTEEESLPKSPPTTPRPRRTRRPRRIADTQQDSIIPEKPSERNRRVLPKISFSIVSDDDETPVEIVKLPASKPTLDKRPIAESQSTFNTTNPQTENRRKASISSRKVSNRGSASSRPDKRLTSTEIDEVVDLIGDLAVTKTRTRLPLIFEDVITISSDEASSSDCNEVGVGNRRTSSRLKKKMQEISSIDNRSTFQNLEECASNDEDEFVILGSNLGRLVTTNTDKSTTAKESVKSSRGRRISKRTT